jgi:hypothetical protein
LALAAAERLILPSDNDRALARAAAALRHMACGGGGEKTRRAFADT